MSTQFRIATHADLAQLLELIRAYYEFDGIAFHADDVERGLRELMLHAELGAAWLIERDGSVLGYFVLTYGFDLEFGGRQATLTEFYLLPPERRRGTGAETLRFIEAHLREQHIGALELQAERDNTEALAFYDRFGFERHDRIPLSKRLR